MQLVPLQHADFAPRGETQRALLAYCEETLGGECEIEQVCCGSGIVRVYEFLKVHRDAADKPELDPAGVTDAVGLSQVECSS
jgi:glucokinase